MHKSFKKSDFPTCVRIRFRIRIRIGIQMESRIRISIKKKLTYEEAGPAVPV